MTSFFSRLCVPHKRKFQTKQKKSLETNAIICVKFVSHLSPSIQSVLQQTSATTPITQDAQDLSTIQENLLEHQDISLYEPNANYETDNNTSDLRVGQQKRQNAHLAPLPMPLTKKQGVSGESCDTARQSASDISIQKYEKDFRYFYFSLTLSLEFEIKKNYQLSQIQTTYQRCHYGQ